MMAECVCGGEGGVCKVVKVGRIETGDTYD